MTIASDLTSRLALSPAATTIVFRGETYVVTTGTGERGYGRDGGACAFAYEADDVSDYLDAHASIERIDYTEFCNAVTCDEDRDLAIYLAAREEMRLTRAGACTPVLSDEEYTLVRETVEALS